MPLWRYCKDMETCFAYFCMPGYTHPKWYYQLAEAFDVYLDAKNKLIIHFFLKILQFNESRNLTGWQHFGPQLNNFARYGGEISIRVLVFILDYFQEKLTWQNFSKNPKILFWGHSGPVLPKLWQKWILLEKRALSVFKYFNYHCTIVPEIRKN